MNNKTSRLLGCLTATILALTACQTSQNGASSRVWEMADLRALESPNAPDPDFDLIAAYTRETRTDIEMRFDLLGSPNLSGYDFYLALDTGKQAGGRLPLNTTAAVNWDLLFSFPARGTAHVITAAGKPAPIRPRSIRSGVEDSITIRISKQSLGSDWMDYSFQAFLTRPGSTKAEDGIGPLTFTIRPQVNQAPLALVFWNALPAATPAQALRRWNGAHTGPFGQRHGLKVLLQAASESGTPLAVLDLARPDRLAALEALGGLELVQNMQRDGLLLIPDLAYGEDEIGKHNLLWNTQSALRFHLQPNSFLYGTLSGVQAAEYQAVFARQADAGHIRVWNNLRLIPLPGVLPGGTDPVSPQGLSVEARRALLLSALSPAEDDLVVLGGDLPTSPWGDSLIAGPALADINRHPWIRLLDQQQLLQFPAQPGLPDCADWLCLNMPENMAPLPELVNVLREAPGNLFSQLAWQSIFSLSEPAPDAQVSALRAAYLGQTGPLIAAARWNPGQKAESSCSSDLDWDGQADCILSSAKYFFVINPQGGRLVFGAAQTKRGPVQLVGQRSQFIVGLGDPLEWRLEAGSAGDPEDIPGGFADATGPWQAYQATVSDAQIVLTQAQSGSRKTFFLDDQGLHVTIETSQPLATRLPLVLIDRGAFSPGWYRHYQGTALDLQNIRWEILNSVRIKIRVEGAQLHLLGFDQSLPTLNQAEDPNFGYPPGSYIPFPLAVVEIQGQTKWTIHISLDIRNQRAIKGMNCPDLPEYCAKPYCGDLHNIHLCDKVWINHRQYGGKPDGKEYPGHHHQSAAHLPASPGAYACSGNSDHLLPRIG